MRNLSKAIVMGAGLLIAGGTANADPITAPATQPAPMVQLNPGTPAATASLASADVYVVPFTSVAGDTSMDWAGRAVQQNLMTDLARGKLRPVAADKTLAKVGDAEAAARAAGAKYVIFGSYQMADQQLRFNGQIIDAASGNVVGGLSATGAPRDLFGLEDSLSTQAVQTLSQLTGLASKGAAAAVPPALQPTVIVQVIQPPAVGQIGQASSYQGSALQQYVDSNQTPSADYSQQVQDAQDRSINGSYNITGYEGTSYFPYYGGGFIGYGGFGGYGFGSGYGSHFGNVGSGFGGSSHFHSFSHQSTGFQR